MKYFCILCIILSVLLLTGCEEYDKIHTLPATAVNFQTSTYVDPYNPYDRYTLVVEYNGRKFVPYGTQKDSFKQQSIKECIGYINGNTNERIYSLVSNNDFLAYHVEGAAINEYTFLRALDTRNQDISIPSFIASSSYKLW